MLAQTQAVGVGGLNGTLPHIWRKEDEQNCMMYADCGLSDFGLYRPLVIFSSLVSFHLANQLEELDILSCGCCCHFHELTAIAPMASSSMTEFSQDPTET